MAINRQPLGIELVKRGIVNQTDITNALDYQANNPDEKMGDILYKLNVTDPETLIQSIGEILEEKGMVFSGINEEADLVEIVELPKHKHFIACQFHPEFKSRPTRPHPLFDSFIKSSIEK